MQIPQVTTICRLCSIKGAISTICLPPPNLCRYYSFVSSSASLQSRMYLAASSVLIPAKNVLTQDGTSPFGTIPTRASMLIPKEREKCATVSSFGLVFPRSKGNAAIRRPELFGQFNLCQAKLMPCPVQGNSKKIANIVHTFTLPIVFILIGTTLLMNAV